MAGSQQYSNLQIYYVLRAALQGKSNSWIQEKFQLRFGRSLSDHQARYIKSKYGKDPKFCTPVANLIHGKVLTQSSGPNTDDASEDDSCLGIDFDALEESSKVTPDAAFRISGGGAAETSLPTLLQDSAAARRTPNLVGRSSHSLSIPSPGSARSSLPGRKRYRDDEPSETERLTKSRYEHINKGPLVSVPKTLNHESFVPSFGHDSLLTQDASNDNNLLCLPNAEARLGTVDFEFTGTTPIRVLNTSPDFLDYKEVPSIVFQQDVELRSDPQKNENMTNTGPMFDIQYMPICDRRSSETQDPLDEFLLYRCYDICDNINPIIDENGDWLYLLPTEFLETMASEINSSPGEEGTSDVVEADAEFLAAVEAAFAKYNEEPVIFPNNFHVEYCPPVFTHETNFEYPSSSANINVESDKASRASAMNSHINRPATNVNRANPEELHLVLADDDGTDIANAVALFGHQGDALSLNDKDASPTTAKAEGSCFGNENYSPKLKETRSSSPCTLPVAE